MKDARQLPCTGLFTPAGRAIRPAEQMTPLTTDAQFINRPVKPLLSKHGDMRAVPRLRAGVDHLSA